MALRAHGLLSTRLWVSGAKALIACNNIASRSTIPLSRASATTAGAATVASPTGDRSSSSSSSSSKTEAQSLTAAGRDTLQGEAADRIARAAAAMDARALRGGFAPSSDDAHSETASRFGGPGASAIGSIVEAVYGVFAGDRKTVERSVGQLSHGSAGVPRRPLTTRWARAAANVGSEQQQQQEEEEAAAIRETLAAYRFAGMGARAVTAEPEAATEQPAAAAAAQAAGPAGATGSKAETGM